MRNWRFAKYFQREPSVEISEKNGNRYLHTDSRTVQSAMKISDPVELVLAYTKAMMGFLLFREEPEHVLMIGLGGGSLPKFVYHNIPNCRITVVEKNHRVVMAARQYFGVPENNERFTVITEEGFKWLDRSRKLFDVIMVDGYDPYSPDETLATVGFYALAHDHLTEQGVLVINCWTRDRRLEKNLQNIGEVFEEMIIIPATRKGNVALMAFKKIIQRSPQNLIKRAKFLENTYSLGFIEMLRDMQEKKHSTLNR